LSADFGADESAARTAEAEGYDSLFVSETHNDPFVDAALAAQATGEVEVGTGIALAFARNPMLTAYSANQLQMLSKGRFVLGLGSQIQAHIEKRFGMPWGSPAARMRDYIAAVRAIWAAWHDEARLDFRGEFYQHTLMPPFFAPGPNPYGPPPILLAAVGDGMTGVAAEAADGIICHAFTTERYLREVTVPAIEARRPTGMAGFRVQMPLLVVTGSTAERMNEAVVATKRRLAFYGSTPAYRRVLELHGWGDLQGELNRLSKTGDWAAMGELITDEILHTFAIVGRPDTIAEQIDRRYGEILTDVGLYRPYPTEPSVTSRIINDVKALARPGVRV
jgi:probable F420-dependent oxidoreductase